MRRGNPDAIAEFAPPCEYPDVLEYVHDWFHELDQARHIGPNGPEGLTYHAIDCWARLTDRSPTPQEVQALMWLDMVKRFPNVGVEQDG